MLREIVNGKRQLQVISWWWEKVVTCLCVGGRVLPEPPVIDPVCCRHTASPAKTPQDRL